MKKTRNVKIWGAAILSAAAVTASAGVLYDNTQTDTGYVLNLLNGQEIGDQIFLDNFTLFPYLTNFSFQYYSPDAAFSGVVTADVRFYYNDGPAFNGYSSPSNIFYDTGWFTLQTPTAALGMATNAAVLNFYLTDLQGGVVPMDPTFQMPSNFTMTVTVQGLSGSDSVGLSSFEPPLVGTNYGDYWFNNGGTWQLLTNTTPVAFGMQFNASATPTPEPGALALVGVGVAALAGFVRRRRQWSSDAGGRRGRIF